MVVIKRLMATMLVVGSLVSPVVAMKDGESKQTSTSGTAVPTTVPLVPTLSGMERAMEGPVRAVESFMDGAVRLANSTIISDDALRATTSQAATGALIGTLICPGVGTGAGATIGTLTGALTVGGRKLIEKFGPCIVEFCPRIVVDYLEKFERNMMQEEQSRRQQREEKLGEGTGLEELQEAEAQSKEETSEDETIEPSRKKARHMSPAALTR